MQNFIRCIQIDIKTLILSLIIITINILRFIGLDVSPPGFYIDEAVGALQIMCLSRDGVDFLGNPYPLFFSGASNTFYTAPYIYSQLLWTFLFGHSIYAYRSFLALVTCLTLFFLFLWARRISNQKIALYVVFAASIVPWSFHFSRIAWDPPLAVLFLMMALWATQLKRFYFIAGFFLALACYSYSPLRLGAIIMGSLLPSITWRKKCICACVFVVSCIPLFLQMQNPEFLSRTHNLLIWSESARNQYYGSNYLGLLIIICKQFLSYLSPHFLFVNGDSNLRHSVPSFGMLSWLDAFAFTGGILFLVYRKFSGREIINKNSWEISFLVVAFLGIFASILPAALTNEGNPHALRSISAWPFFALITGLALYKIGDYWKKNVIFSLTIIIGISFFTTYLLRYFKEYPQLASAAFSVESEPLALAYYDLTKNKSDCRTGISNTRKNLEIPKINSGQSILFSAQGRGNKYLGDGWHSPEVWGVWSNGLNSKLNIPLSDPLPKKIEFTIQAFVTPHAPKQTIEIWINNAQFKTINLIDGKPLLIALSLPSGLIPDQNLLIELRTPNPYSPVQAGISLTDTRQLGLGLISIRFD